MPDKCPGGWALLELTEPLRNFPMDMTALNEARAWKTDQSYVTFIAERKGYLSAGVILSGKTNCFYETFYSRATSYVSKIVGNLIQF